MNITKDDPLLTAYALGEVTDEERAAVERFLDENPDARAEIREIRAAANLLAKELAAEDAPALTREQRAAVLEAAAPAPVRAPVRTPFRHGRLVLRIAFAAGIVFVIGAVLLPSLARTRGASSSFSLSRVFQTKTDRRQEVREEARVEQLAVTGAAQSVPTAPQPEPAVSGKEQAEFAAQPPQQNIRADFTGKSEAFVQVDGNEASGVFLMHSAETPAGGQGGFGVPQVPAEVRDLLQSLGYLSPKDGLDRREYWNRPVPMPTPAPGSESYAPISENAFTRVADAPLSTFGVDVDTASYANVRRFLTQGTLPPPDAVRVEELVNYFRYEYPAPQTEHPFSVNVETHPCPWNPGHLLARIGLRGKDVAVEERAPVNLVFLVDVSGSMQPPEKLPLLVKGLKLLAESLTGRDRLSIVTYAGSAGVRLAPTPGDQRAAIHGVLDSLAAGGSTNGEGGIRIAYDLARAAFIPGGANRVMLATDGDFNVGVSDTDALVSMIQQQAKTGVFLTVLGFGTGNLQDSRMESLADKGNGQYFYIDSFQEARRALLEQAAGALVTIAKDVKIQVEFNPARVSHYRLIGYENRALAARDFNDDRKDAGEIGAGHTVTALYELVPPGVQPAPPQVDALKYQPVPEAPKPEAAPDEARPASNELMTVKLRYKRPDADTSTRLDVPVAGDTVAAAPGADHQFAAAVAAWGMLLRRSAHAGTANLDLVLQLAEAGKGADLDGRRAEFITLVRTTAALMGHRPAL